EETDGEYEETGGEDASVLEQNKTILEKDGVSTEDQQKRDGAVEQIKADAKTITGENSLVKVNGKTGSNAADDNSVMLQSPAAGSVVSKFDVRKKLFGIAISNKENTPIICIAEGMIVYSGFDPEGGNTLIVQHAGNLMSIYKHNAQLYKTVGSRVKAGETIASMGSSGKSSFKVHLWFELWYNGVAVNPQEYIVVQP
ncbi:MAG: M23 family metallopeptidase, partial [Bacteroidales bacterium]|nr:M23 family metallopeptidase [Bacteroidales bacterium]